MLRGTSIEKESVNNGHMQTDTEWICPFLCDSRG